MGRMARDAKRRELNMYVHLMAYCFTVGYSLEDIVSTAINETIKKFNTM